MSNPFENPEGSYFVLVNEEGQHSLWPSFINVPHGWKKIYGAADRQACLAYIRDHWHNLMPNSLKPTASIGNGK
ncbi:MbtH family protein [Virgibacillus halophilus]|uniref:MbtH family protein n=1 Tax=Tigheibacillus halophilus TaxID=361280 RepID=A0ABU5C1N5_9BACI|nr:MbtH family protein [Virgibacillus halophilus]